MRRTAIVLRVERFVKWLLNREEEVVAVVGHSAFFREMAGVQADNCSVWRLKLSGQGEWGCAEELLRCPQLD